VAEVTVLEVSPATAIAFKVEVLLKTTGLVYTVELAEGVVPFVV
jgi:hypothetical protein